MNDGGELEEPPQVGDDLGQGLPAAEAEVDAETRERLKALGYVR